MASATGRLIKGLRGNRGEIVFDGASVGEWRQWVDVWWIKLIGRAVLLASIAYTQISEVFPSESRWEA